VQKPLWLLLGRAVARLLRYCAAAAAPDNRSRGCTSRVQKRSCW
jgi:hypothetical protein